MASSIEGGGDRKTLKEGERVLAPTRRPDGTLRKSIRFKAGYFPQDEVVIYKSKGTLEMKSMESVPPGYNPQLDVAVSKPKSKSAKRNERKKDKRFQQDSLDKGNSKVSSNEDVDRPSESIESIVSQLNEITISGNPSVATPPLSSTELSAPRDHVPDIVKRIRALKKKIRLTEAQQEKVGNDLKPEQLDKLAKLEDWRQELKLLEDKKASLEATL